MSRHPETPTPLSPKEFVFDLLESGDRMPTSARLIDLFFCLLIVVNVAMVAAETVDHLYAAYGRAFLYFEYVSVAIFTVEYIARLWVCTELQPLKREGPIAARLKFARTPYMIIDFVAVAPFYFSWLIGVDLRFIRVFRLLRLFKLVRYSTAMSTLARVLYEERRALVASLIIMLGLLMFTSSIVYFIEREAQPDKFGSIPASMWWALATLTTVGYGDVVPVTALGKLFGGAVTVLGLGLYGLPIAIIASGFTNEFQRREFVVSWGMVANVPLFATLDAMSVARIAQLLQSREVPENYVIFRDGERATCMYFIAAGEIDIRIGDSDIQLGDGDFFGEIALLHDRPRMGTAMTRTVCKLMVLDAGDFHHLLNSNPDLKDVVMQIADRRMDLDEAEDAAKP